MTFFVFGCGWRGYDGHSCCRAKGRGGVEGLIEAGSWSKVEGYRWQVRSIIGKIWTRLV